MLSNNKLTLMQYLGHRRVEFIEKLLYFGSGKTFHIFLIIFSGIFLTPILNIYISNNSATYLFGAATLLNEGYVPFLKDGLVARGPIYTVFISASNYLADYDLIKIFYLQKLLLSLGLAWLIARYVNTYFQSALLLAFVYANYKFLSYSFAIDTTGLYSLLTGFLFLIATNKTRYDSATIIKLALLVVLLFLTKETGLFFGLIIGLHILKYEGLKSAFYYIVAVFIMILPWVFYVHLRADSIWAILGHFNPHYLAATVNDVTENKMLDGSIYDIVSTLITKMFIQPYPAASIFLFFLLSAKVYNLMGAIQVSTKRKVPASTSIGILLLFVSTILPALDFFVGGADPRQSAATIMISTVLFGQYLSSKNK